MINETDFHITKNMPEIKMNTIINVEGVCPVCNSKNTFYKTCYRHQHKVWQNSYSCKSCTSEWKGNTYDTTFKRITFEEEQHLIKQQQQQNSLFCLFI